MNLFHWVKNSIIFEICIFFSSNFLDEFIEEIKSIQGNIIRFIDNGNDEEENYVTIMYDLILYRGA